MQMALSLALTVLLAALGGIQEESQTPWEDYFPTNWPEAPAEVLPAYIDAVKGSPTYAMAHALRRDATEQEMGTWREIREFVMATRYVPFPRLLEGVGFPGADGATYEFNRISTRDLADLDGVTDIPSSVEFLELKVESGGRESRYRVSLARLRDLNFGTFFSATVQSPLYELKDRHSVNNLPLMEVVDSLCRQAGVGFSYSATKAKGILVTQELQDRTIKDCLEMAARAADFTVVYDGITSSEVIQIKAVREKLVEYRQKVDPKDDHLITPMNVLKEMVCAQALAMREQGVAVTLEPRSSSP